VDGLLDMIEALAAQPNLGASAQDISTGLLRKAAPLT
jgi:hypothetical protein